MELNTIRLRLQTARISAVSRATGVSYGTIHAIKNGSNTNPTHEVLRKLGDHLGATASRAEEVPHDAAS